MPGWIFPAVGAAVAAALYAVMASFYADVGVAQLIAGSILFAGVGAMVTAALTARRSTRRG
jgi:tellurite resistance protein TehA-like permease